MITFELFGTEKQIVWAQSIREKFLKKLPTVDQIVGINEDNFFDYPYAVQDLINDSGKRAEILEDVEKFIRIYEKKYVEFFSQESAKFWIDNRDIRNRVLAKFLFSEWTNGYEWN